MNDNVHDVKEYREEESQEKTKEKNKKLL